jgi:PAS domain S-box-containing protein
MNEIEQVTKRWQREREARKTAERILEEKSRELYAINQELLQLATENITKEEWSRSIFEAAAEGIIIVNTEATILSMNRAAKNIFGIPENETPDFNIKTILTDDSSAQVFRSLSAQDKAIASNITYETSAKNIHGQQFPIEVSISSANPGNQCIYIIIVHNITERKNAEQKLNDSRRQFEIILETVVEGILGLDKDGNFIFLNSAASKMLGWNPQELIGKSSHELIHHTHEDGTKHNKQDCPIYKSVQMNCGVNMIEDIFWRKDGTSFPVEYFSRLIQEAGLVTGAVVSFRDITTRKEQEKEKKIIEMQLHQAQKLESIGQLAAGIAHEINTPAQYINDNTHFLNSGVSDLFAYIALLEKTISEIPSQDNQFIQNRNILMEKAKSIDLEYMKNEIPLAITQSIEGLERITKIVSAMKEFSHPGVEEKTAININSALDSTINVSRNEWKYYADIVRNYQDQLPDLICYPAELNQAFLNIIVNAAHAIKDSLEFSNEEKGQITISTREGDGVIEVEISDSGSGIPEEIIPKIFDPFFTTKAVGKGTGQGLSITYSAVVQKHGGTIDIGNIPNGGASFLIRLPMQLG